jgi:hypothetical protein
MTMVTDLPDPDRTAESVDDRDPVHLVHSAGRPPPGGGTCQCIRCGLYFQSKSTTWTTDRRKHDDNAFTGNFKSCSGDADKG